MGSHETSSYVKYDTTSKSRTPDSGVPISSAMRMVADHMNALENESNAVTRRLGTLVMVRTCRRHMVMYVRVCSMYTNNSMVFHCYCNTASYACIPYMHVYMCTAYT